MHSRRRGHTLRLVALLLLSAALAPARAAPAASADDTADCIAVMQDKADDLARRIKAGDRSQEPALRVELERAAALIGRAYLDGFRDGRAAKARLEAARRAQTTWDEGRKRRVRGACLERADAELASASRAERFVVERVTRSRLERMLNKP